MAEFSGFTLSPARVHQRARERTGHHPVWISRPYGGGIYSIEHFRICSWCSCIHPLDLIDLLHKGRSSFAPATKPGKFLLTTPNSVAGELVRMGTMSGPVFDRGQEPLSLRHRLTDRAKRGLAFSPSIAERLSGQFERPALEIAPVMIVWPFYAEHTTDRQWPEIWEAAKGLGRAGTCGD